MIHSICYKFANDHLCSIGPRPKCLKLGQDLMEEEVQELFEPSNNKNQYQNCFNDNVALINHIEEIWIILINELNTIYTCLINEAEASC